MSSFIVSDEKLKDVIKASVLEALQENKEMFYELFAEAIEDQALAAAIKEGNRTPLVENGKVRKLLRR